jgi:hypothetical protein
MGEWREIEISYLKPNRIACELCGQLVARSFWVSEIDGEEKVFCNPDHELTYRSYWLPRYGRRPAGAA